MGKGSSRPTDVVGAAEVEGEYGREAVTTQTYANRPNQSNAFGNVAWQTEQGIDPATGEPVTTWNQTETLTPQLQGLLDTELENATSRADLSANLSPRIAEEMSAPVDWGSFGEYREGPEAARTGEFNWASPNRQRAEDDSYGRSVRRLDPKFEKDRQALELRLRGRGLAAGDQQYQSEMELFNTGRNDAYEMARMGATSEGRAEDSQSFRQANTAWDTNRRTEQQSFDQRSRAAATANALREKKIAETLAKRNFSLNEQERLKPDVQTIAETYSGGS